MTDAVSAGPHACSRRRMSAAPSRPVDMGVLSRFDAFFRTGAPSSLEGASGDEAGQLRLFGVRAGGQGES